VDARKAGNQQLPNACSTCWQSAAVANCGMHKASCPVDAAAGNFPSLQLLLAGMLHLMMMCLQGPCWHQPGIAWRSSHQPTSVCTCPRWWRCITVRLRWLNMDHSLLLSAAPRQDVHITSVPCRRANTTVLATVLLTMLPVSPGSA